MNHLKYTYNIKATKVQKAFSLNLFQQLLFITGRVISKIKIKKFKNRKKKKFNTQLIKTVIK